MTQHVFIVGGSSGIGLASARHLLEQGFRVTIAGRDRGRLQSAVAGLGSAVKGVSLDATDSAQLATVLGQVGPIDHLVLAFGSGKGVGPFVSVDSASVRQGFEEKVFPHFACAQAALPALAKTGSITFLAAVSAHAAVPGTAGIGAANAAVAALVPILAAELRPLRVNGISPGIIDTPWWNFLSSEQKQGAFADYASKTPVGRVGRPEDIAAAVGFLISNTFMNGHVMVCDGGIRLSF